MKILFIADQDQKYGAAKSMLELVTTLKNMYDITPIVATCDFGIINEKLTKDSIENVVIGHRPFMVGIGSTWWKKLIKAILKPFIKNYYLFKNKRAVLKLESSVNFNEIDLVYTNVNRIDLGALLATKYSKPHIWHVREFGDIDYPLISYRDNYINFMNSHTTKFILISKTVQEAWVQKGLDNNKIKLVYNGVTKNISVPAVKTSEKFKIVFTGSISETKQQIQLVEACINLPPSVKERIQVDFYGSGFKNYIKSLERKIQKNKLTNLINIKGYTENITEKLTEYDLGIICSRAEGFGRVTVEYMMAGLPVIASNTGANNELIINDINGYLYEYNNVQDLATKITCLVNDREKSKIMGLKGKEIALNNFTKERNSENIYRVIKEICKDR